MQEDISLRVRSTLSKLLKIVWKKVDIADTDNLDRTLLANCDLRAFVKPGTKTDILLQSLANSSLNEVLNYGRNITNKVVKFLPAIFKHLIHNVYVSSYNPPPVLVINKIKPINKISSKSLQDLLKTTFNKSKPFTINSKYNLMCDGILEEKGTWFNLWKIKNPHLRNYRSKVAYKDVYSQERRFKFRLNDSPQCRICKNRVESVQHQLFECRNAQRMWQIYVDMFADNISFKNLVCVGNFPAAEIVKATIIKLLIQIDRSEHLAIHQIYLRIIQMLTLEASITKDPIYTNLVNLLSNKIITTSSDNASD